MVMREGGAALRREAGKKAKSRAKNMVLKPQTERTVKLLTAVATTWVGFHTVFRTE
jgi:hypothetical protein